MTIDQLAERLARERKKAAQALHHDYRPEEIFHLARTDVVVNAHVHAWRAGLVTWEPMLISLVGALSRQSHRFQQLLEEALQLQSPRIIIQGKARDAFLADGEAFFVKQVDPAQVEQPKEDAGT